MKQYFIYGLFKNDQLFYIGVTTDVSKREMDHKRAYGKDVALQTLEEYYGSYKVALVLEEFWIKKQLDLGVDLINKAKSTSVKKTYTFASRPSIIEMAKQLAFEEGVTLSEKISQFLEEYARDEDIDEDAPVGKIIDPSFV